MDTYQEQDAAIVDYEMWEFRRDPKLPRGALHLRGPAPGDGPFLCCLGSAHTFGRYCPQPYPALLGERLGLEVYNFSRGGFGPRAWLDNPVILDVVNRSRCVVLQVTSARGQTSSLFPRGQRYGQRVRSLDGRSLGARDALREVLRGRPGREVWRILEEMRRSYVEQTIALLRSITPPTVLLWFSKRRPRYVPRRFTVNALLGDFPGLVNDEMLDVLRPHADRFVSVVTRRGVPQRLRDRRSGKRLGRNTYYPSPEMHIDAAAALAPACRALIAGG